MSIEGRDPRGAMVTVVGFYEPVTGRERSEGVVAVLKEMLHPERAYGPR